MKKDQKIEALEKRVEMLEAMVKALSTQPIIQYVPYMQQPQIIRVPVPYYPPYPIWYNQANGPQAGLSNQANCGGTAPQQYGQLN